MEQLQQKSVLAGNVAPQAKLGVAFAGALLWTDILWGHKGAVSASFDSYNGGRVTQGFRGKFGAPRQSPAMTGPPALTTARIPHRISVGRRFPPSAFSSLPEAIDEHAWGPQPG